MTEDQVWISCLACKGNGYMKQDCGEDTCNCLEPEDEECDGCNGDGGWWE